MYFIRIFIVPRIRLTKKLQRWTFDFFSEILNLQNSLYMDNGEDPEFYPPESISRNAHIKSEAQYREMYENSLKNPTEFWSTILHRAEFKFEKSWEKDKFLDYNFDLRKGPIYIKWLAGASTNVCYNCVDRNVAKGLGDKVAFYWEGNYPGDQNKMTFNELLVEICKFANVLKLKGVKRGDRVAIYLPMILQLPVAMLACARIGAVHSVVFGGFSDESLAARIVDAGAHVLITADGFFRGTKLIHLKNIADDAIEICSRQNYLLKCCIVVKHLSCDHSVDTNGANVNGDNPLENVPGRPASGFRIKFNGSLDVWYHDAMSRASSTCDVEWMDSEDPLFILHTSGSTGKPKGVLHTQAGYMLYTYATLLYVFDCHDDDICFCTADIGWITGHSYVTYGPLLNGCTGVMFEGSPFYPDAGRLWEIVDKYGVTKFYTAPTLIRALLKQGDSFVTKSNRKTLKILGTAGEPINPAAWLWYYNTVGDERCPVIDTYWQTEMGGKVLTPFPGWTTMKPGSVAFPFFGVEPAMLNEKGYEIHGAGKGYLAFKRPWPGFMRLIFQNQERFEAVYFSRFPGYYCTGDGCRRDADGYYWITGRVDDMMNVSGHLLSSAEIESALVSHDSVAEAAVVPAPHKIKGQVPYAFITLKNGRTFSSGLTDDLKAVMRKKIGAIAVPYYFQNAPGLPKTHSGKILRRILQKIALDDEDFGDKTTMEDEAVVVQLIGSRQTSIVPID